MFRFVCNSYLVNSYLLVSDRKTAILIDPAYGNQEESEMLKKFVKENYIRILTVIATHTHADHIMGVKRVMDIFPDASFLMHHEGLFFYHMANDHSVIMGFEKQEFPSPSQFVRDGEIVKVSDIQLEVLVTPGHAPGSICLYNKKDNLLFTGDVLFRESIGRTDMWGGSLNTLKKSIFEKLFTLPPETVVLPGHGDQTTIDYEQKHNPFLN